MTSMTMLISSLALAAAVAINACGPAPNPAPGDAHASLFASAPSAHWRLSRRLQEISGLALSPDGRAFAHNDERAVVYEVDLTDGAIRKAFALGEDGERGDFEGIAITPEGDFWLTTSDGRLYRFREGDEGAHVAFQRFESGLDRVCEIEGLAYLASTQSLILACKTNHARDMRNTIALYAWPIANSGPAALWRSLPEAELTAAANVDSFRPSSVEVDPVSGRILLLSANDGALAELNPEGELLAARALGSDHVQAEGMTIIGDGALLIADEGGRGQAQLARYERVHD